MGLIVRPLRPKCSLPNEHTPLYSSPVMTGFQPGLYHTEIEYWPQTVPLTMCVKCKGTQHYLSHWALQTSQMHIMVFLTCLPGSFHSYSLIPAQGHKTGNKLFCKSRQNWRILRAYSLNKYNHLKLLREILKINVLSSFPHPWRWLLFFSLTSEQLMSENFRKPTLLLCKTLLPQIFNS